MDIDWTALSEEITHIYKVGNQTFLPAYEDKATVLARHKGLKLTKINRPKKAKN